MPSQDELPDYNLPADIKYDSLLGICTVMWQQNDEEGCEVDVVVVDEAGQAKIAHIDWDDEY